MAGLPWVKVATDFAEHPKMIALASRLNDPCAPLHLPPIWGHFARHYAGGSMPDTDDAHRALERAALWGGAPGALVAALVDVGLLQRRRKRLAVHGWEEWQDGHARKLERDRERMRAKRAEAREKGRATVERGSRDGRGTEERERRGDPSSLRSEGAASVPASPASPVVFTLRCSGKGPKTYDVTQAQVDEWSAAFPGVDVVAEIRKSAAWQDANPAKRKTHRGMASHLVGWLGRKQDGGRGRANGQPRATEPQRDIRFGVAPPAPPEAFSGGRRPLSTGPAATDTWGAEVSQ